jgi:hypothetical protein
MRYARKVSDHFRIKLVCGVPECLGKSDKDATVDGMAPHHPILLSLYNQTQDHVSRTATLYYNSADHDFSHAVEDVCSRHKREIDKTTPERLLSHTCISSLYFHRSQKTQHNQNKGKK